MSASRLAMNARMSVTLIEECDPREAAGWSRGHAGARCCRIPPPMAFAPGTRLGAFEVGALIGVGGMGEVYRATDSGLKRPVAIKVLPASVAGDPRRVARFQREAEILAALNHPNIAHIHGLEKSDGTLALMMELVEGPTLADRIAKEPDRKTDRGGAGSRA